LRHNTLAVVILYGGKIVAERYAKGISPTAQLPGWSMAKSFTTTIIGLLVAREQLDIHQPGAVMEWGNQKDRILSPQP
jgi:CubicO group peptidase (beta-lactamase class C family)